MPSSLGQLIKRRRAQLGMTQARLAELVGKSASAVRSWERGRATPKGKTTRAALAAVLGVTDDELDAAIEGADISFFSDPGRPIAADPTPTIVVPAQPGMAVGDADSQTDEASDRRSQSSVLGLAPSITGSDEVAAMPDEPAEEPATSEVDEPADAADSVTEPEPPEPPDSEPEQPTAEPDLFETEAELPESVAEDLESEPDFFESERESESDSRELVGVGSFLSTLEGAATRLVERRQTTSRPAAILAPSPVVEADPVSQDAWLYRRRLLLLGVAVLVLVVVLRWALGGVGDAIAEVLDNLRTGA